MPRGKPADLSSQSERFEEYAPPEMNTETVPGGVKSLLERHELNGIPILLSETSDLSLDGAERRHWVVATRDNLAVVTDEAEPSLLGHVPLDRVEKFRSQGAIGSGFLQAYVEGGWVDLARYSNTRATRFHVLAEQARRPALHRRGAR